MITPQDFAAAIHELSDPRFIQADKARNSIDEFIKNANATQLRTGMRLVTKITSLTMDYFQKAMDASNLRFQEKSAEATERHIKQTEELKRLTSFHIEHTKALRRWK